MKSRLLTIVVVGVALTAMGCTSDSDDTAETTTTTVEATTSTTVAETTTTTLAEATTTTSTVEATTTTTVAETTTTTTTASTDPPTRVLFVGNSFTFRHRGLKTQMRLLAASAGPPLSIETEESVAGGATLERHWNFMSTPRKIASGDYDIVVLQGDIPESDVETFKENARNLVNATRATGAEPVFFMAWPYERLGWITMDEIAQAHADIATELDVPVAPVGLAFERASAERPELNMLASDNEHASAEGAHLVAYVIYMTLFGTEPPALTVLIERDPITEEDATFLHRIARETVTEYEAERTS